MTSDARKGRDGAPFLDVLREDSTLLLDAEEALLQVVEGVQRTGKAGKVTLSLTIVQPKQASDRTAVFIAGNVKVSMPTPDTENHMFFAVDGRLSRRDPRQPQLPVFAAVDKTTGEIHDDGAAGEAATQ